MPMAANEIESLIREAFPNADIEVSGDDGVQTDGHCRAASGPGIGD